MTQESTPVSRVDAMGLLARAPADLLARLMPELPAHALLRGPEIGTVMVRGRQGGAGAPFNLGEMTLTRCSVRLDCGAVGHAHVQGRDRDHALRAAVLDALLQTAAAPQLRAQILTPIAHAEAQARQTRARHAAATRVEFFTLVRGDAP